MTAFISLNEPIEDKKEIGRWLDLHHCQPMPYPSMDKGIVIAVKIPLVCRLLEFKDGIYYCREYDSRPIVCKEYFCQRAKQS